MLAFMDLTLSSVGQYPKRQSVVHSPYPETIYSELLVLRPLKIHVVCPLKDIVPYQIIKAFACFQSRQPADNDKVLACPDPDSILC